MRRVRFTAWTVGLAARVGLTFTAVAQAEPSVDGPWTRYEDLAPVVGADGQTHEATCSGVPGTDPAFSFWAKKGAPKNILVTGSSVGG